MAILKEQDIQEIMKVLLRSGFEVVMEREGKYTNDLYCCYQAFAKYYPARQNTMRRVLFLYLNPPIYDAEFLPVILDLGQMLLEEIQQYNLSEK